MEGQRGPVIVRGHLNTERDFLSRSVNKTLGTILHCRRAWHDADQWKRDIEKIAGHENVLCKISGIVARAPEGWSPKDLAPIVNHCLDSFGPQRVVFGSDWPVCRLRASLLDWVAALHEIISPRPEEEQAALWNGNASRFYGLN